MNVNKPALNSKIRFSPTANSLDRFNHLFLCYWKTFLYWQNKSLKKPEHETIHQLRIALRRFRLSIKLYEFITSTKANHKFKKRLRKLTNKLGSLRNIDEAESYFHTHTSLSARHPCYSHLKAMRSVQVKQIKESLRKFDHHVETVILKMNTHLKSISYTEENNHKLLTHASNISSALSKKIHEHLANATEKKKRKSRHLLRIAIRKWRYYLELFSIVLNRDYDSLLKILKSYQSLLGQINDLATFNKLCRDMNLSPPDAKFIKNILLDDEKSQLKKYTKLINRNPL